MTRCSPSRAAVASLIPWMSRCAELFGLCLVVLAWPVLRRLHRLRADDQMLANSRRSRIAHTMDVKVHAAPITVAEGPFHTAHPSLPQVLHPAMAIPVFVVKIVGIMVAQLSQLPLLLIIRPPNVLPYGFGFVPFVRTPRRIACTNRVRHRFHDFVSVILCFFEPLRIDVDGMRCCEEDASGCCIFSDDLAVGV